MAAVHYVGLIPIIVWCNGSVYKKYMHRHCAMAADIFEIYAHGVYIRKLCAIVFMTSRPLTQKDFKLRNLTKTEFATILVHVLVSLAFWTIYKFDLIPAEEIKGWISGYYFVVPFAIVGLFFRSLRNFKFYIPWLVISIGQLVVYFMVDGQTEFFYPRGTAFSALKALFPTLTLFQLFRIILLRTQGRELIVTIRMGRFTMWEEKDNRNMTWIEVAFSLLLMGTIVTFNVV